MKTQYRILYKMAYEASGNFRVNTDFTFVFRFFFFFCISSEFSCQYAYVTVDFLTKKNQLRKMTFLP